MSFIQSTTNLHSWPFSIQIKLQLKFLLIKKHHWQSDEKVSPFIRLSCHILFSLVIIEQHKQENIYAILKVGKFQQTQISVPRYHVEYRFFPFLNKRRIYLFYVYHTHDEMEKFNFVSKPSIVLKNKFIQNIFVWRKCEVCEIL